MSTLSYVIAVFCSLLMHGLLILFMTHSWQHSAPQVEIRRPQVIQASLVELEAKAPQKPPENNVIDLTEQRRREAEERARAEAEQKRIAAEKRAQEAAEKKRLEEERQRELEEQRQREEQERLAREAQEQRRIDEFNEALSEEEGYEASVASQELVASVQALIQQKVGSYWNSPPSARRGMVATVRVTMVPTGRLVQVDVIESSGNAAFDRAVVQAVQKAQPFESVRTLDSTVFEQNFRVFSFRFDPQNLRL